MGEENVATPTLTVKSLLGWALSLGKRASATLLLTLSAISKAFSLPALIKIAENSSPP